MRKFTLSAVFFVVLSIFGAFGCAEHNPNSNLTPYQQHLLEEYGGIDNPPAQYTEGVTEYEEPRKTGSANTGARAIGAFMSLFFGFVIAVLLMIPPVAMLILGYFLDWLIEKAPRDWWGERAARFVAWFTCVYIVNPFILVNYVVLAVFLGVIGLSGGGAAGGIFGATLGLFVGLVFVPGILTCCACLIVPILISVRRFQVASGIRYPSCTD